MTCTYTFTVRNSNGRCELVEERIDPAGRKKTTVYSGALKKIIYGPGVKTEYYAKKAPDGKCCVYQQDFRQVPGGWATSGSEKGPLFCEGGAPVTFQADCNVWG